MKEKNINFRILLNVIQKKKEVKNLRVNHYLEDKLLLFEITEELDHHEVERIRKRADYEIQRVMPKKVIFDFKKVSFMDSAGIGLIVGRYKFANLYGANTELINVNEKVRKIFEMSGVLKIIPIIDNYNSERIG